MLQDLSRMHAYSSFHCIQKLLPFQYNSEPYFQCLAQCYLADHLQYTPESFIAIRLHICNIMVLGNLQVNLRNYQQRL